MLSFLSNPFFLWGTVAVSLLIFLGVLAKQEKMSTKMLAYIAIALALALVLNQIRLFQMPQGGSVSAGSMLMLALIAYWFGAGPGIMAGIVFGLLSLAIRPYILHPAQVLLDYPMAYGALGLAGLAFFRNKNRLWLGYIVGVLGRFVFVFLSGFIFWGAYAEGNPIIHSFAYNASYIVPEIIISLAILAIEPFKNAINLIRTKANN